ncbi:hypothetical protein GCM10007421_16720 [Halopseudomonas oceani]|uniref:DUF1819 domain-containing protein n=1 Tax=Halopseudomonas oceani TaxID=1708783 RepID=A0A2P4ESM1_9GAMM|nr:DUF1819 family protein [Halopseudomonas oceani]POB02053.1 DUF1819 domain-containing protein [Halopseudomonas oceani]GGE43160.1 hypothetical protein GCM10007421_16720 [Halopseudomonas oceani]
MSELYRLSFTTGGLFIQESPMVAELFLLSRDWQSTRDQVREQNLLQVRTAAAAMRISKEIVARLELLDVGELEALVEGNRKDLGYLLWAACARRYAFIREFATEVVREHLLVRRRTLSPVDFDSFWSRKALWHAELDQIAESTQKKLKQNLFRMLREADLLSESMQIQPALLSPALAQLLAEKGKEELLIYPATDQEIVRWLQ